MNPNRGSPLVILATVLVYFFLYAPIVVLILYSFNASRANVKFEGFISSFSDRVQMDGSYVMSSPCGAFHWYCDLSKNDDVKEAAGNTLTIAFVATIVSTTIGTMAALALQRYDFKLKPFSQLSLYIPIGDTPLAYSNAFFVAGCLVIIAGTSSRLVAGEDWRTFQSLYAESFRNMSNSERAEFIINTSSPVSLVILGLLSGILLIIISAFLARMV